MPRWKCRDLTAHYSFTWTVSIGNYTGLKQTRLEINCINCCSKNRIFNAINLLHLIKYSNFISWALSLPHVSGNCAAISKIEKAAISKFSQWTWHHNMVDEGYIRGHSDHCFAMELSDNVAFGYQPTILTYSAAGSKRLVAMWNDLKRFVSQWHYQFPASRKSGRWWGHQAGSPQYMNNLKSCQKPLYYCNNLLQNITLFDDILGTNATVHTMHWRQWQSLIRNSSWLTITYILFLCGKITASFPPSLLSTVCDTAVIKEHHQFEVSQSRQHLTILSTEIINNSNPTRCT